MKNKKNKHGWTGDVVGITFAMIIFVIPFVFMLVNSLKDRKEANLLTLSLPTSIVWDNYKTIFENNNGQIFTAFKNSFLLAFFSVIGLIIVSSMAGYVLQRRRDKTTKIVNVLILSGLMMPPAILPTIWLLQRMQIYKTLFSMVCIEIALQIPFTIMLYRGYIASIPVELEEAGYIDGCNKWQLFLKIIYPLLKPITATVTILNAVTIFNDFTNPLYFLPGRENVTVQLTLYNFMGRYSSSFNLLFANVITITIPMLILFIFFNKRIIDGMVAGAVKG
jgi:ABC-type sugar transport system, permease component